MFERVLGGTVCKLNYLSGLKVIRLHAGRITEKQGGKGGFGEVLMSWREHIPSQIPVLNPSEVPSVLKNWVSIEVSRDSLHFVCRRAHSASNAGLCLVAWKPNLEKDS